MLLTITIEGLTLTAITTTEKDALMLDFMYTCIFLIKFAGLGHLRI